MPEAILSEWVLELLKTAVSSGVVVGVIGWVVQSIVRQTLSRDIERFRSDLEKEAILHKVRYESLHLKQAEIMEKLYLHISRTETAFTRFMAPYQPAGASEGELGETAAKEANEMQDYYYERRLYFDEGLATELDELMNEFKGTWSNFRLSRSLRASDSDDAREWNDAWEKISKLIPTKKSKIEERFRQLLGVRTSA